MGAESRLNLNDKLEAGMRLIDQAAGGTYGLESSRTDEDLLPTHLSTHVVHGAHQKQNRMINSVKDLRSSNAMEIDRFEGLTLNGKSLADHSIGGFLMDEAKAAKIIKEVLPLPALQLPIIFASSQLNFLHHFFNGILLLIGPESMTYIVEERRHASSSRPEFLSMLHKFMLEGKVATDTQTTVLVKRVLLSTFQPYNCDEGITSKSEFTIAVNTWGFDYIEPGMSCKEEHLRMWLSMAYAKYRTVWFNEFKSAGMPLFANDGVQCSGRKFRISRGDSIEATTNPSSIEPEPRTEGTRKKKSTPSKKQLDAPRQTRKSPGILALF